jgi:hypothetical protein
VLAVCALKNVDPVTLLLDKCKIEFQFNMYGEVLASWNVVTRSEIEQEAPDALCGPWPNPKKKGRPKKNRFKKGKPPKKKRQTKPSGSALISEAPMSPQEAALDGASQKHQEVSVAAPSLQPASAKLGILDRILEADAKFTAAASLPPQAVGTNEQESQSAKSAKEASSPPPAPSAPPSSHDEGSSKPTEALSKPSKPPLQFSQPNPLAESVMATLPGLKNMPWATPQRYQQSCPIDGIAKPFYHGINTRPWLIPRLAAVAQDPEEELARAVAASIEAHGRRRTRARYHAQTDLRSI